MRYWYITKTGEDPVCTATDDDALPEGYDGWAVTEIDRLLEWGETVVAGQIVKALDVTRDTKWAEVKAKRDELEFSPAPTSFGHPVDMDPKSKERVLGLVMMANLAMLQGVPFSDTFTFHDNHEQTLTGAEIIQLGQEMGAWVSSIHAVGRDVRAILWPETGDPDPEDVAAIDVETLPWPS